MDPTQIIEGKHNPLFFCLFVFSSTSHQTHVLGKFRYCNNNIMFVNIQKLLKFKDQKFYVNSKYKNFKKIRTIKILQKSVLKLKES